jgi:YD repeat-containing protein
LQLHAVWLFAVLRHFRHLVLFLVLGFLMPSEALTFGEQAHDGRDELDEEHTYVDDVIPARAICGGQAKNDLGNILTKTYADGTLWRFEYDAAGRLTRLSHSGGPLFRYDYDTVTGQLKGITGPAHTVTDSHDPVRRHLLVRENRAGSSGAGAVISRHAYTVAGFGRRAAVSQSGSAFAAAGTGGTTGYRYNERDEIAAAVHAADPARNRAYGYDAIGNRQWATDGGPVAAGAPEDPNPLAGVLREYTANSVNHYTQIASAAPGESRAPAHDLNGNLVSDGAGASCEWDEDQNYTEIAMPGVHSDVGGGYRDRGKRANNALSRMWEDGVINPA